MEKRVVVSISLLTAGKKKELKKCLDSLQPLMQAVPSELIIVDTGCNEENRALIEQYATQIVDFSWCNDFSKARNVGLEKANGEWFLYLDDDEWFEDMSEIIAFFQTGEYRKYQYAMYLVRNYEDFEGKRYNDSPVGRMIRLQPDTHFIYAIHECFANVGTDTKYLNDYVHHYGYVYKNEEEMFAHARRNLIPLLVEHEREPGNLRHTLQLMQEYQSLQEYDRVEELGCSAIQKYDSEDNEQIYYFNSLLVLTLLALVKQEKVNKLTALGEQLRNHPYIGKLAEAYVCALLTYGYRETEKYPESMQCTENYLSLWEEYKKDSSYFTPFETGILAPCFQKKTIQAVLENGIMSAINFGDLSIAVSWNEMLGWNQEEMNASELLYTTAVNSLWKYEGKADKDAVAICSLMMSRGQVAEYMRSKIEELLSQLSLVEQHKLLLFCSKLQVDEWFYQKNADISNISDIAENIWDDLYEYADMQYEWYNLLSKNSLQKEKSYIKSKGYETAVIIVRLKEQIANGYYRDAVESLREIIELQPKWAVVVKRCTMEVSHLIEGQVKEEKRQREELEVLAKQVKQQVRGLVQSGYLKEAAKILHQLKTMIPEDKEIQELLRKTDISD